MTRVPAMCLVMIGVLTVSVACGNSEPSPERSAYLKDARQASQSIKGGEAGRDETLLAVGKDWCRWLQSPDFGSIPVRQFFDEIDIGARDGAVIRRAAESHLCPE